MHNFDEILAQYKPMIYHMIKKLHIQQDHDIYFQEGLLALWKAWERFDENEGAFTPFAYQSIRGGMLTYMRKDNRYKEKEVIVAEEFWEMKMDGGTDRTLEEEFLACYADHLSLQQKKWILFTFHYQWTTAEIAQYEGVSQSAVKKWKKGAMDKLKANNETAW
ncbi:hypothetical protein KP78_12990 [Jeotgalibacillus soli]|uniref:RNA polymerase sigma-70 region 2 domain-containing protein n=2 Tax=Jeotgalibacillus soli TaxID=889306 RepID=A0A0C2VZM6_9BACL|nr:hypothetical protein KP78_12990 [Jeotgalibacillus soli]